jgi:phosphatidylinositol alpha-1,6-mannosyltransferase
LFSALLRAAQVVFAISQGTANTALGLGVKPERIRVIHPAVNPAQLASKIPPEMVRQRYGLQGKKCILTVGRLVERKGFDTVIRALPAILEVIPEAHYLIVGGGPAEAGLKALVADLGLETYVTFAGPKSHDEVADYYLASDLFVMISREIPGKGDVEGFGIVYLEANLLGRPVVAGRSGGVADAVVHEETGLLVDPRDPAGVAAAVVRVLSDSDLAQRLGENGRSRVLSDFSGAAAAQKVLVALSDSCLAR